MTQIHYDKPIRRETACTYRRRAIVVELHPGHLVVRLKGLRHGYTVSYEGILVLGAKIAADAARAERKERKRKK